MITLTVTLIAPVNAQADPDDPGPTDLLWAFTIRGPFIDGRLAIAFDLLIDRDTVLATAPAGTRLLYGDPQLRAESARATVNDVPSLFQAAGVADSDPDRLQLTEVRICAVWAAPPGEESAINTDVRESVTTALGDEIRRALADYGVATQPCALAPDSVTADIVVWGAENPAPESTLSAPPDRSGFLELTRASSRSLLWAFANYFPFHDLRVADAIDILIDERAVLLAAGVDGIWSLEAGHRDPPHGADGDMTRARALLAAAGLGEPDEPLTLFGVRPCTVFWISNFDSASTEREIEDRRALALALSAALADALTQLGVTVEPCSLASNPANADLLIWDPALPLLLPRVGSGWFRETGGFLSDEPPPRTQLQAGANEILWTGPRDSIEHALAPISGRYSAVYHWDNEAQQWLVAAPALPSALQTLTRFEPDTIYWIITTEAVEL